MSSHLRHCPKHRKPLPCPHCALTAKPTQTVVVMDGPEEVPAANPEVSVLVPGVPVTEPEIPNVIQQPPKSASKRGRSPKHEVPMTAAERKRESRVNQKAEQDEAQRQELITELMETYDRQASSVIVIALGSDSEAIAKAEERRGQDRGQRQNYLDELQRLSLEELKLAREGKKTSDSHHGKNDAMSRTIATGGMTEIKLEHIIENDLRESGGPEISATPVKPEGVDPNNPTANSAPSRWSRVPASELRRWNNIEQKFREMAQAWFKKDALTGQHFCTICGTTVNSFDAAVDHLWSEYYAGEKLWARVDELEDPDIVDIVGPLLQDARITAGKATHYPWICRWLNSRG